MEILKKFTDFAVNSGWCVDGESTQNGFLFYNAQTNDRWIGWQAAQIPVAPESFEQAYSEIFSPIVKRPYPRLENGDYKYIEIDQGWKLWQAATAQVVPKGFVLVPKENISCYWQDNDEPENFCSNESDFDCLGDCIDLSEIMEINKFTQAHVNKEILFGTWFAEAIDPSEKANFFVGTHAECLEIVAKNKAMIEAQEQSHECPNP